MMIKKATTDDISTLVSLRLMYLAETMRGLTQQERAGIEARLRAYFHAHIQDRSCIGAFAEADRRVASIACLAISEKPAGPAFGTGKTGTLLNVFTLPEHRRKGLATEVLTFLLDEARKEGVSSVDLLATGDGKPVYEKLGFATIPYTPMRISLVQAPKPGNRTFPDKQKPE